MDIEKINRESAIVFDFDGTMCRLFVHYDLNKTVSIMQTRMQAYGIDFCEKLDAFDVFSEIEKQTSDLDDVRELAFFEADRILTLAEIEAASTGECVEGVVEVLTKLLDKGVKIGIATNNSEECVKTFLMRFFSNLTIPIVGRIGNKPWLMKPNKWTLIETSKRLNCSVNDLLFIGDTKRDYECSRIVGCGFLGMASTRTKEEKLSELCGSNIIHNYYELWDLINGKI